MPRLNGHSYQDNQAYKSEKQLKEEHENDPLKKLQPFLVPEQFSRDGWNEIEQEVASEVNNAVEEGLGRPEPDLKQTTNHVFEEKEAERSVQQQQSGGLDQSRQSVPKTADIPAV